MTYQQDYHRALRELADLRAGVEALVDEWRAAGFEIEPDQLAALLASSTPATTSDAVEGPTELARHSASEGATEIAELIETSSLGAPEAQALRATVSDEHAARIVARSKELEAEATGVTSSDGDRGLSEEVPRAKTAEEIAGDTPGRLVRQALADHFVMWHPPQRIDMGSGPRPGEWRCACGKKFGFSDSAIDHQAEEVGRILAARTAQSEGVERVEWQTCPDGSQLPPIRGHSSPHEAGRYLEPGRHLVRRTVTTYAPVVGPWEPVEEGEQ